MDKIRNIAIIAHVDHGKTTLVDQLLRQSGTFRSNQVVAERVMDSMDLEKEKGITIKAKNAAFEYKDYHVNIVDTPGHADFGGEVERILKMIDGVLLVVDAFDGPQAQTKFVLRKALEVGAKPIVVINKIDRENARPHKVLDMIFELFLELKATDEQLDFTTIYASAKQGFAVTDWKGEVTQECRDAGMTAIYEAVIKHIPAPVCDPSKYFEMLVTNLDYSDYLGRIAYGKIYGGTVNVGDKVVALHKDGTKHKAAVTALFSHQGLQKVQIQQSSAGDIVGLAGFEEIYIGETITDQEDRPAIPFVDIDPPTIKMQFLVNDSPLAGREGKFLTARHIRDRLVRETRLNVSIQFVDTDMAGVFEVSARGEMQIAILVEQMRREGFEIMVSRPEVIYKRDSNGNVLEPFETLYVEVPNDKQGDVLQNLAARKAVVSNMVYHTTTMSIEAVIPTRGLIGFETDLVNMTRGEGIMSHLFKEYGPKAGEIITRSSGVLISMETGEATAFALNNIQERGRLFLSPGQQIYEGMIVGENSRPDDMAVNPCKAKHLTNMRSQGDGKGIQLDAPMKLTLERALEYIAPDEFVEATPLSLRLRKRILDENKRRRVAKSIGD
ncbi:MAG: translational GTPase TypA [Candidatus Methylacidiphilales bacterium]|nr:translational GTPase TypA [Candidatus Methylacidiphilales bacterium]